MTIMQIGIKTPVKIAILSSCQGSERPKAVTVAVRAAAMPSASSTIAPEVSSAKLSNKASTSQL
ncbi:hypothetical protein HORIV_49110 [Vreelandella olivaria]|uniref:Uncharacterized protein n=1 Tax=Vreelandella olivaria TaxID=390919 RepID=A0ABN5X5W0_9GAMM|nr:hypothetical protein HORIV_49110 [Halomonas olivaria]